MFLRAALALVAVVAIAAVAVVALILSGPTEFNLIRGRAAAIIQQGLGRDYTVQIGRSVLDVDPVLGFVVRLDDIEVRDGAGQVVASVPSTRLAVDPSSLLLFHVKVSQIELADPQVALARDAAGKIYLGNANTQRGAAPTSTALALPPASGDVSDGGFPDLVAALYLIDRSIEPQLQGAIDAGFERFAVVNGTLTLFEAGSDDQRRFPGTDFSVAVDKNTSAVSATLATSGYGGRWTAQIDRESDPSNGSHLLSAVFSQLTVADIFPTLGDADSPLTADIPLYGRASIRFGSDGAVQDASVRLDLGAGTLHFDENRETLLLDEATIRLHWDIANRALVLDNSTFYVGDTRGAFTGKVTPVGDPALRRYAFDFESPGSVLAPRDTGEAPIVARRIALSGVVDLKAKVLNIENALIMAADATVAAAGSMDFSGPTPSLAMAATFSPMKVATLKQIWIPFIAPGARHWVMEHVGGGNLISGRFEAAIPSGVMWLTKRPRMPDDAIRLTMQLDDVDFTTFGKLPPIVNASGNIVVSGQTVGIDVDKGEVRVPAGTVSVDNAAFAIPNTTKRPADALVELELSGSAAALGEIADADPLRALARQKVDPEDLTGSGTASISVRFPLRPALTDADVDWKVLVNTKDVASKGLIEGRRVSEANVKLTATPNDVSVYGKARIEGVGADVSMSFPVGTSGEPTAGGDRRVRLLVDDDARKKLGVGLDDVISGSLSALVSEAPDGTSQHYDLDLRKARVVLPGLGWAKGIGVPATLVFDLKPAAGGYAVENLELKGDGFGFNGSAVLDESYNLQSADIERLSLHPGDEVSLRLVRGKSGYAITARGQAFDLRGLIGYIRDRNDQSGGFPDLAIDAQLDKLIGFNHQEIDNAALTLVSVGGETQKVSFTGKIGTAPVSLDYAVAPDGTTLDASADDAGELLRFIDIYTRIGGGQLRVTGAAPRDGAISGTAELDNFSIINEPAMNRIVTRKSADAGPGLNPGNVPFTRMVARFRRNAQVLAIEDALMSGPTVGATFSGRYDFSAATIDITGTYLPVYAFNNLFGRIPILGIALGGGSTEGLIGVTFQIDGPIGQPEVAFNPLSAVAPGIFRKIFEFQRPDQ